MLKFGSTKRLPLSVPPSASAVEVAGQGAVLQLVGRKPIRNFISARLFFLSMVAGVIFILAGFWLEDRLDDFEVIYQNITTPRQASAQPATSLTHQSVDVTSIGTTAVTTTGGRETHKLTRGLVVVLLLKELGVACLVAGIVGMIIERQAKEHDRRRAEEMQVALATNAVFALFGLSHDKEFIQAVVDTNLKAEIVRTDLTQIYKLRKLTTQEADEVNPSAPTDAMQRFVVLDMVQHYAFKNVSSAPLKLDIPLAVSRRSGAGASHVTKATYVSLGGVVLSATEIEAAIDHSDSNEHYLSYKFRRTINSGCTLSVVANLACLKERSDNEVWASYFPTMGTVTLTLEVLDGMIFGLRNVSNGHLTVKDEVPSEIRKTWVLTGPLLRHNSAVFWWRTPADDGAPGATTAVETTIAPSADPVAETELTELMPNNQEYGPVRGGFRKIIEGLRGKT